MRYSTHALSCGALALLTLAACSKTPEASATGGPPGEGKGGGASGAASAAKGGGPGGPGRGPSALVLGPTDVTSVATHTIEASIPISGDLRPIEEIVVRARVEGDVLQVLVREGDRVRAGQLLARFENAVQEGEQVSATADRESARADVANAQWNAEQSDELFKAGAIPERDLRTAQQALAAAKARLAAAEARLRAASQNAQDTRITSPTSGVVATRTVESGERVSRGATLFTVVRNDVLELEATVPARLANELKVAQLVRFASGGRSMEGRVARIAPTINPASRTITVYVQVPNRDGAIKGNAFATGRVVGQTLANTVAIPTPAVRQSARGDVPFVYRIVGGKVEVADVELGVVDETLNMTQVLRGLSVGDQIVVGNVGALGRGVEVRVMSGEGGAGRPAAAGGAGAAPAAAGAGGTSAARPDTTRSR